MGIIFMGTPDLAATVFDKLIASNLIYLQHLHNRIDQLEEAKIKYSPVKDSLEHNIPVLPTNRAGMKSLWE